MTMTFKNYFIFWALIDVIVMIFVSQIIYLLKACLGHFTAVYLSVKKPRSIIFRKRSNCNMRDLVYAKVEKLREV